MKIILQSIRILLVFTVLTGLLYPLAMTGLAQLIMPVKANGSMVTRNGQLVGSELVGQTFALDKYFWPRPSAVGYNPVPSGGTNLGPTSSTLRDSVAARAARFSMPVGVIPPDLLEASGSGLDPHISPEAALFQADRVAAARSIERADMDKLVSLMTHLTEPPQWGIFGQPRINVLRLNLALDSVFSR